MHGATAGARDERCVQRGTPGSARRKLVAARTADIGLSDWGRQAAPGRLGPSTNLIASDGHEEGRAIDAYG
eukprot:COSAG02_NODE_16265_length_1098_cov_1.100100_1_plen_70_part_10